MKRPLAWVLGGGGSRGALQAGAMRALLEADIQPDMLVGTSIGAANAAFLATHGVDLTTMDDLEEVWHDAAGANLLPSNYLWLTVRVFFDRVEWQPYDRLREFLVAHGLTPDLRFGDIQGVRLTLVAADLNSGRIVLYGTDPEESVLEGVLASTALPPWVRPMEVDGQSLIDGGVVSTLPVKPALEQGAKEIIALDLSDPRDVRADDHGFSAFAGKLMHTIETRQRETEMALAEMYDVDVSVIVLCDVEPVAIWDFSHTDELIARGYEIGSSEARSWLSQRQRWWERWLTRLKGLWHERRESAGESSDRDEERLMGHLHKTG